jgi:hypothetical protein
MHSVFAKRKHVREVLNLYLTVRSECLDKSFRRALPPILFQHPNYLNCPTGVRLYVGDLSRTPRMEAVWSEGVEVGGVFALSFSAHEQPAYATILDVKHRNSFALGPLPVCPSDLLPCYQHSDRVLAVVHLASRLHFPMDDPIDLHTRLIVRGEG